MQLNELQLPTLKIDYEDTDTNKTTFTYENGLLTGTALNNEIFTTINYDDDTIITSNPNEKEAKAISIYTRDPETDNLLTKTMVVYDQDYSNPVNHTYTDKQNGNYLERYYRDEELVHKNYASKKGVYPYSEDFFAYQNGELMQEIKSRLKKVSESVFELYYENTTTKKYELYRTFFLNNNNMITRIVPSSNKESITYFKYFYYD